MTPTITAQPDAADKTSLPLVELQDLHTYFELDAGVVRAVSGVNMRIPAGRTVCVVGESGCGKSVMAFSILRLLTAPGRIVRGRILLHRDGTIIDLAALPADGMAIRKIRGKEIAMIFQEPMSSLSPVHTVGSQIAEAVRLHADVSRAHARRHTIEMMQRVGFPDAAHRYDTYPHQLSGGLRQRAMIAMALSCQPRLLIADEPTTALDVTIQAQILDLIRDLQSELGMSVLLITHDLGVVAEMADLVAVMYMGRIVEWGSVYDVLQSSQHPYTQALLESIPGRYADRTVPLKVISGSVPDAFARIPGCSFHPRCKLAEPGICDQSPAPDLREVRRGHLTACLVRQRQALSQGEGADHD